MKYISNLLSPFKIETSLYGVFKVCCFIMLFLFNPTIALLTSFVLLLGYKEPSKSDYVAFYICLAGWLGVLNMTKQLFSDQFYYARVFVHADVSNFIEAVIKYRGGKFELREPAFNLFSVICRLLYGPNPRAYFFTCTFIIYLLQFMALDRVLRHSDREKFEIICSILLSAFFYNAFIQSIHVLRQAIAMSIVIYAIAFKTTTGKNLWIFLLTAVLMHNMTAFFVLLSLIPLLYDKLSLKNTIYFIMGYVVLMATYVQIGTFFEGVDLATISTIGSRMSSTRIDKVEFFSWYVLLVYAIPSLLSAVSIIYRNKDRQELPLMFFSVFYILTFLLIISFSGRQTMQARYSFCLYSLMPFVLPFILPKGNFYQRMFCITITLFFVYRFFFVDLNWKLFESIDNILLNNFSYFWNTKYYNI